MYIVSIQVFYWGCIWLEKTSNGKDIFVTNMMLGSGAVLYWFFDCDGNHYAFPGQEKCAACEYVGNNHVFFDDDFSMPVSYIVIAPDGSTVTYKFLAFLI